MHDCNDPPIAKFIHSLIRFATVHFKKTILDILLDIRRAISTYHSMFKNAPKGSARFNLFGGKAI
jgi:hypothetical protein